jgi:hypothetical protein
MPTEQGILSWLEQQAQGGPLISRSGDLHDLPGPLSDVLGQGGGLEPRENPDEGELSAEGNPSAQVEGPPLPEEEYRSAVRRLTSGMRDRILMMSKGLSEEARAGLARKVRRIRHKALSGDLFGGFLRQNPPAPGARTSARRDYTRDYKEMRENAPPQEISKRSFRELAQGVFAHLKDELQARTEALSASERGYVVEKLKATRAALDPSRQNPEGGSQTSSEGASPGEDAPLNEEKPWWVEEGPENPDRFASRNKAEQRGVLLGCGEEYHEHEEGGETFYMPCPTHEEWKKKTGRDNPFRDNSSRENPSTNFHEAKVGGEGESSYETYRREGDPEGFGRGIQVLYGIRPKGEEGPRGGRSEIAALFYPAGEWNAANARRHAAAHVGLKEFNEASRENPASPQARDVELRIGYDLERGGRSLKEVIQWAKKRAEEESGDLLWIDKGTPSEGPPQEVEIGMEVFGVRRAAALHHRFEEFTRADEPGVGSIRTASVSMAEEIAGDPDLMTTVTVQYSVAELPQVSPADPPKDDRFFESAKRMVKSTLGGWVVGATETAAPRTVRFGFSTARDAIQAEGFLKDATEHYASTRVHVSSITDESSVTDESGHQSGEPTQSEPTESTDPLRMNARTSHAGGDSRLVRVTHMTEPQGRFEFDPEIERTVRQAARASGGEIVGTREAPSGQTRDRYVEFETPEAAGRFTRQLNTTFFERGLEDRALAVQERPSRLAARENPSEGGGAVVRIGVQTGKLPDSAPDLLSVVEETAEQNGGDITGVRQSEGGSVKDYLVTAPTTQEAQSIITGLNNRLSTLGASEAATVTLQHEARQNEARQNESRGNAARESDSRENPPAEVRVAINQENLPGDAPDPLSTVEEVAESEGGEISGVEQSGGGEVRDYTIEAPTTEKAQSIITGLNNRLSTLGMSEASTVTLQHEARQNESRGNEARQNESPQNEPSESEPSDGKPRENPASTVMVRYPSGNAGLESAVQEAATGAGGTVSHVGAPSGSKYSGMKEAEVRFNSEPEAFEGVGQIESALRSKQVGEFEATAVTESDVPPVRPNPLFPTGGQSALSIQDSPPESEGAGPTTLQDSPPESQAGPVTLASEPTGTGSAGGGSALSFDTKEAPPGVVSKARRLGEKAGEEDGLPEFSGEEGAFEHAVQALPGTDVMEGIDISTPEGLSALEEAASAWANGYAEATGSNWPRLNPHADPSNGDTSNQDSSKPEPAPIVEPSGESGGTEPQSKAPTRKNPDGKQGGREALSYLGITAALLGGGVYLADSVLATRERTAPETAIVNEQS